MVGAGVDRHRYEARIEPLEPVAAVGSGDAFLAGYVAARYDGREPARTASPSGSPAAPSRPSISAPATSIVARSSASCRGSRCARSRPRQTSPSPAAPGFLPNVRRPPSRRVDRCYHRDDLRRWGRRAARCGFSSPFRGAFFVRHHAYLSGDHGSRNRQRQEGQAGLRVRRHRDRAVTAHPGSR